MSREKKPRKQTAKPAKKPTSKQALTPKQEKFVQVYIKTSNASEAYRQAYNAGGMKDQAIHVNASKLLSSAKVALRVEELQAAQQKRFEITQDRWLAEYVALGFSDMSTMTEWDQATGVKVKSSADLPQHVKAAVQSIEQTPNGLKIKLHDKKGALDAIGKHFGWFEKDNRQAGQAAGEAIATATDELISRIARLAARAAEDRGTEGNKRG